MPKDYERGRETVFGIHREVRREPLPEDNKDSGKYRGFRSAADKLAEQAIINKEFLAPSEVYPVFSGDADGILEARSNKSTINNRATPIKSTPASQPHVHVQYVVADRRLQTPTNNPAYTNDSSTLAITEFWILLENKDSHDPTHTFYRGYDMERAQEVYDVAMSRDNHGVNQQVVMRYAVWRHLM